MRRGTLVLVVEDDLDVRAMLSQVLEIEGYTVATAANGVEALDRLRSVGRPSVIILDLMMPVMNGWQFIAEQAQDPNLASIPVVVLSGDCGADARATAVGAADVLRKPIDIHTLIETVDRYC